jgi:hypothetical protein
MDFLKRLFGIGGASSDGAYYVYVRPKMCKEVVRLRLNLTNDPSVNDDESGYVLRKTASAIRCPFQAEITLHLNKSRGVIDREISNGEFVTEADYLAFMQKAEEAASAVAAASSYPSAKQVPAKPNDAPFLDINVLSQQLKQEDPEQFDLQKAVLETLPKVASPEAVKIARNVIDNFENRSLVNLAMDALAKMLTDESFAALSDMMVNHPKLANRGAAVLALGRTDDVRAIPPIKKLLSDGLVSEEGLPILDALRALSSMSGSRLRAVEDLAPIVNQWKDRGGEYKTLWEKITRLAITD